MLNRYFPEVEVYLRKQVSQLKSYIGALMPVL